MFNIAKKIILAAGILTFSSGHFSAFGSNNINEDAAGSTKPALTQLSETLYVAKHPNGVSFVMERVKDNPARLNFWKQWQSNEIDIHHADYKRAWAKGSIPHNRGFLMFQSPEAGLDTGLSSFGHVLLDAEWTKEVWVAFACQNEIKSEADISADYIEMAVTVTTDPLAPMITLMGISRSFSYLLRALKTMSDQDALENFGEARCKEMFGSDFLGKSQYILHSNLSLLLQSLAAQVMLSRNGPQIYMITTPVPAMSAIMRKAFQNNATYGDNVERATRKLWAIKSEDAEFITLESKKIRSNIKISVDNQGEIRGKLRQLEMESKDATIEYAELMASEKQLEVKIRTLIEEEEIARAREIQAFSEAEPCFVANAPLRCQSYPDQMVQIFDLEGKAVLYEFNRTKDRVTIGDFVLDTKNDRRFHWFIWTGMNQTLRNPYVVVPLNVLAEYFYKSSSAPVIEKPVVGGGYLSQAKSAVLNAYASLPLFSSLWGSAASNK